MSLLLPRRAGIAALLLSGAVLAGCGDDSSGPTPGSHPAAMLLDGEVDARWYGDENSALYFAVVAAGFPLDTSSQYDSTSIASLLAGKDILFLPEYNYPGDAPAQAAIKAFAQGGGTVVLTGGSSHLSWVNSAFGFTLGSAESWYDRHPMPRTDAADGTPFESGPANLLANDGIELLDAAALPTGTALAYLGPNDDTDASVAIIPTGSGRLIYVGWNFYDAKPIGLQDGGWLKLLSLTAGF